MRRPTCILNGDILRIEQQRAGGPVRGRQDCRAIESEIAPRDFRFAAIPAKASTRGQELTREDGSLVRPDHDLAAVACPNRAGIQRGVLIDDGLRRVMNARIGPVEVSTDENFAATRVTPGVDRRAGQPNLVTEEMNRSASLTQLQVRCVNSTSNDQRPGQAGIRRDSSSGVHDARRRIDRQLRIGQELNVGGIGLDLSRYRDGSRRRRQVARVQIKQSHEQDGV